LNRGPHPPEIWAKFWVVVRNTWKSDGLVVAPPPLGFADLAVDSRGLGSEIELLPNGDVADGDGLADASWLCRRAVARAAAQVPNRRVTTLAAGQSPDLSRSSATPPRPTRVRPRPVVGRRQPALAGAPVAHRVEHPLGRPAGLDRTGAARLAVRVRVALAVPRLRVRAAAAAHALVAGLDRPCLLAGRVLSA
jgi:hypothetical protein